MSGTGVDRYDTPIKIAQEMIRAVKVVRPEIVADFAVGGGCLLRAASERWPKAQVVATDICAGTIAAVRREHPDWRAGVADFLNHCSVSKCRAATQSRKRTDLVLVNPPFSCRGAKRFQVSYGGQVIACSTAMAFILNCLEFLSPRGELVAVIPEGIWSSERDRRAWQLIRGGFRVCHVQRFERDAFSDCFVQTRIVRLVPHNDRTVVPRRSVVPEVCNVHPPSSLPTVEVIRGSVQMHTVRHADGSAAPLIHTSSLRENQVLLGQLKAPRARAWVSGHLVILPRVCEPSREKVCILHSLSDVALSDCVFALRCIDAATAESLFRRLVVNWLTVRRCYTGTCAKYTTVQRIMQVVHALGFAPTTCVAGRDSCRRGAELADLSLVVSETTGRTRVPSGRSTAGRSNSSSVSAAAAAVRLIR